jgi:DNA polymerase-1
MRGRERRSQSFCRQSLLPRFDGLKLAAALLHERREECPGATPILAVHDEIVVECEETEATEVEAWLKRAMVEGMEGTINAPDLGRSGVPVEVEAGRARTWG